MLGRKQRIRDLEYDLQKAEDALAGLQKLEDANKRSQDRIVLLQRQTAHAEQGRDEAMDRAHEYSQQIDRLARWFQDKAPSKIGEGGAVDNAIRLLDLTGLLEDEVARLQAENERYAEQVDGMNAQLADGDRAIGMQDAELKELKIKYDRLVKATTTTQLGTSTKPKPANKS